MGKGAGTGDLGLLSDRMEKPAADSIIPLNLGDMHNVEQLLNDVRIPQFVRVKQHHACNELGNATEKLMSEIGKVVMNEGLKLDGKKIAVAVGSRGIFGIDRIVSTTVQAVRDLHAIPFIVPAMGSHGGATSEGQTDVLAGLGVTGSLVGAPVVSSMTVQSVGVIDGTIPVYVDDNVLKSDGVVLINRIKPHTGFRGIVESGLTKMSVIGLGKQKSAEICHRIGYTNFDQRLLAMSKMVFSKVPILFGIAVIEDAYHRTADIIAIRGHDIHAAEPGLLAKARELMPRIFFNPLDIIIIDQVGKEISGAGMDANVTGRFHSTYGWHQQRVNRVVVLSLTDMSEGNGVGLGLADIITSRVARAINLGKTYMNALTLCDPSAGKLPLVMANDCYAIKAAIKTANTLKGDLDLRIVRIKNTLKLDEVFVSEALLPDATHNSFIEVLDHPRDFRFNRDGTLEEVW